MVVPSMVVVMIGMRAAMLRHAVHSTSACISGMCEAMVGPAPGARQLSLTVKWLVLPTDNAYLHHIRLLWKRHFDELEYTPDCREMGGARQSRTLTKQPEVALCHGMELMLIYANWWRLYLLLAIPGADCKHRACR